MGSQCPRIFVYGTLRKGSFNNWRLDNQTYVGQATTADPFYMVRTKSGTQPFISAEQIFPDTEPCRIVGDVYEVSPTTLAQLDLLEGHPTMFVRRLIGLVDGSAAYAYLLEAAQLRAEISAAVGRFVPVASGDFIGQ